MPKIHVRSYSSHPPRLKISNWINGEEIRLAVDDSGFTVDPGKTYNFRSYTQTLSNEGLYTLKAWEDGLPESTGGLIQVLNYPPQPVGSLCFVTFYIDVAFGPTTVMPIGDTPAAFDDASTTLIDTPVIIDVLSNDDTNEQTLNLTSMAVTGGPTNGGTSVNAIGEITYTPDVQFSGTDTFISWTTPRVTSRTRRPSRSQ